MSTPTTLLNIPHTPESSFEQHITQYILALNFYARFETINPYKEGFEISYRGYLERIVTEDIKHVLDFEKYSSLYFMTVFVLKNFDPPYFQYTQC